MKFYCEKNEIAANLHQVTKLISSKAALPVFEGVYMEIIGDTCRFVGGNARIISEVSFKVDVKEEGYGLVNARIFYDIIRLCNENSTIEVCSDSVREEHSGEPKRILRVISGKSSSFINTLPAESYPMPKIKGEPWSFTMEAKTFKECVRGSFFCAMSENFLSSSNMVFTGVYIKKEEDSIDFVAIDGSRVGIRRGKAEGDSGTVLIPAKILDEITKAIGDEDSIHISVYENYVKILWNDVSFCCTMLEKENYYNYKDVIPKEHKVRTKVERRSVIASIERAVILSKAKQNNLLIFEVKDDLMTVSARSALGEVYDEIDIWHEGEPVKIGINGNYLLDALRAVDDEYIYMEYQGSRNPCVIKPCDESGRYIYLIMPILSD